MNNSLKKLSQIMILSLAFCIYAEEESSQAANFKEIATVELKKMADEKKTFTLIDARSPEEYKEAHIIGAINVPANDWDNFTKNLPKDKDQLLITYCNGVQCGKSKKAAIKAGAMGYKNILLYKEGFPVWEEAGFELVKGPGYGKKIETNKLSAQELKALIDKKDGSIIIVDVRDPKEYKEGHIPSAINVPVAEFAARSGEISKKKRVIVYCNTGSRSYLAYKKLVNMAYKNINQTLFKDWKEAKMELSLN